MSLIKPLMWLHTVTAPPVIVVLFLFVHLCRSEMTAEHKRGKFEAVSTNRQRMLCISCLLFLSFTPEAAF